MNDALCHLFEFFHGNVHLEGRRRKETFPMNQSIHVQECACVTCGFNKCCMFGPALFVTAAKNTAISTRFHMLLSSGHRTIIIQLGNFSEEHPRGKTEVGASVSMRACLQSCSVLTDEPVNTPSGSDISGRLLLRVQIQTSRLVCFASRYQIKAATLSHKHACFPPHLPTAATSRVSASSGESTNSRA